MSWTVRAPAKGRRGAGREPPPGLARSGILAIALGLVVQSCGPAASWRPAPGYPIVPGVAPVASAEPATGESGRGGGRSTSGAVGAGAATAEVDLQAFDEETPAEPAASQVVVELEAPYKLGERRLPQTLAAQRADLLDRRQWNDGGLGTLVAEQPAPAGHPDPRVRVNIDEAKGGLSAATIERIARRNHWINVVRCYRLGAYQDQSMRGWTHGRFNVSRAGKVSRTRLRKTELEDPKVAKCLIEHLRKVAFPAARAGTTAKVAIKVSPGDDPMPPPEDLILPGEGTLAPELMVAGVEPAKARFETCFRAGLEYAPELWGRIPIRFHLSEQGTLDEAFDNGGRFPDPRVRQCVLREARKLRFARPKDGEIRFIVPVRLYSDRSAIPPSASARP